MTTPPFEDEPVNLQNELNEILDDVQDIRNTDTGNARRFINEYREIVRFCHQWNRWIVWDSTRWKRDTQGKTIELGKTLIRNMYSDVQSIGNDNVRKAMIRHALKSEGRRGLENMLFLAQSEPGAPIDATELDTFQHLLNCPNGTVDLKTGQLLPHNKEQMITRSTPTEYDPIKMSDLWIQFLMDITNNNIELVNYLQLAAGYSLTGAIRDHVLFFLYGTGCNGKSTFLNTIINTLGPDYAKTGPRDLLTMKRGGDSHPTATATLHGLRFIATIEAEGGRPLAESLVKSLTGGDVVSTRRMREDYWEFTPTHKIWLAANHKPNIRGTDDAIWRRIKLIPFTTVIPECKMDTELTAKLRLETPAILAWCVQGSILWHDLGLVDPACVQEASKAYRDEMDVLGAWISERCITGFALEAKAKDLFDNYRDWCMENNEGKWSVLNNRNFSISLQERGYFKKRSKNGYYYENITISTELTP